MADETYYEILDVPRTAGQDRILTSYRSLAKQFHPDREPGVNPGVRKLMTRRFQQVSEAYSTLKDPAKRREYDAALDMLESPEYYQPMVVQPPPHSSSPSPVRRASPKWQPLWASNNLRGMAIGTIFCLAAILPLVLMCLDPSGKKAAAAPTVQATPTVRKAPAPVVVKPATVAPAPVVRPAAPHGQRQNRVAGGPRTLMAEQAQNTEWQDYKPTGNEGWAAGRKPATSSGPTGVAAEPATQGHARPAVCTAACTKGRSTTAMPY